MLAEMYGVSHQEQHENPEKDQEMLEKAALYFQPDSILSVFNNPGPSLAVGDRMTRFPGHDMDPNGSFQFVEGEYMKGEDYDAFIEDPADWSIRKYWPRVFTELEGLALLPPLGMAAFGTYSLPNLSFSRRRRWHGPSGSHPRRGSSGCADARAMASAQRLAALGFALPTFVGSVTEAPFDLMSDTLRGMRGIMLNSTADRRSCWPLRKRFFASSLNMPSVGAGLRVSTFPLFLSTGARTVACLCLSSRNFTGPSSKP